METATSAGKAVASGRRSRTERLVSAGGVVYRPGPDTMEVALCGRLDPPRWSLPKGTPDAGETREETALREVQEETGLEVQIVAPLGQIDYWFSVGGVRHHKMVHHYLMEPIGGSIDQHDPEFDVVAWFPLQEAERVLTYRNEAEVLRRAQEVLEGRHGAAR